MKNLRREFIKTTSAFTAGIVAAPHLVAETTKWSLKRGPICLFTKCLQFLEFGQLGEALAYMGLDGADLPVRPRGYILPENVTTDLPKIVKALQKSGVNVPMMVTNIMSADSKETDRILGTASELGIQHYRMGYLTYNQNKSIRENLDEHKRTFEKLEKVNRKYRIHGEYQNHSGVRVGGPVWDLYWLVKDLDPEYIGIQYDIRHAVCEGGKSWPLGMKLLAPWAKTTAIKDFFWEYNNGKWNIKNVSLGEGMVDFDAYNKEYNKLEMSGPVSLHCEYDLGGAENGKKNPNMSNDEIFRKIKKDVDWLKNKFDGNKI